jgi:hypothetical protein
MFPVSPPGRSEKEEKMARSRRILVTISLLALALLYGAAGAFAQLASIYRFRDVSVPLTLKAEQTVIEKGTYDLEFMRSSSPVLYFLRFMKRGKILAIVQGEEWPYDVGLITEVARSIPKSPIMKMKINRNEMLLSFVVESGRNNRDYPNLRAVFKLPFED